MLSGLVVFVQFALFLGIGIGVACFFQEYPPTVPIQSGDEAFAIFIVGHMPAGLVGLTLAAVFAAVLLLSLYSFAIWQNLTPDGRQIDCGCFASSAKVPLSGWLVARNVVLMLAACVLVMPNPARALIWVDGLTVLAALFTLWVLWTAGQRLASTGPALRRRGAAR